MNNATVTIDASKKRRWLARQIALGDSRRFLECGGLKAPSGLDWYRNCGKRRSAWTSKYMCQSFKITIVDYLDAEADAVQLLLGTDDNGVPWYLREWDPKTQVDADHIFRHLREHHQWLFGYEQGIPWRFTVNALSGWLDSTSHRMKETAFREGYKNSKKGRVWWKVPGTGFAADPARLAWEKVHIVVQRKSDVANNPTERQSFPFKNHQRIHAKTRKLQSSDLTYDSLVDFAKMHTTFSEYRDVLEIDWPDHLGDHVIKPFDVLNDDDLQTALIIMQPRVGNGRDIVFNIKTMPAEPWESWLDMTIYDPNMDIEYLSVINPDVLTPF